MGILPHPVTGQLLGKLPLPKAVREQTLGLCLMELFGGIFRENVWEKCLRIFYEGSMGEKFGHFLRENLQGIFRRNARECLGFWGDFLWKIANGKCLGDCLGLIIRKILRDVPGEMYGGEFLGEFVCGKHLREYGGILREIFQGNVWGLSRKALSGRNVI